MNENQKVVEPTREDLIVELALSRTRCQYQHEELIKLYDEVERLWRKISEKDDEIFEWRQKIYDLECVIDDLKFELKLNHK